MKINIKDLLDKKQISRYELSKRIGVTYPTVTALYNGTSTSIKFEILEAICKELECTPNDIIESDDPYVQRLLTYYSMLKNVNQK